MSSFGGKKKVFRAQAEKLHHFLKQSPTQSLHFLMKFQYPLMHTCSCRK